MGYVDPKLEAGILIQRITKETLGATEAWTDGRYSTRNTLNWTTGCGTGQCDGMCSKVHSRDTQVEPSHGFVAWQALVDGNAPKSSNDPAKTLQPMLATPKARMRRRRKKGSQHGH